MNTTRNGKIARLPRELRDQLSQRIDDGQPSEKLIAWLNALPEVQSVLAELFEGRPLNTQNITEWRQGGYQDWLELQETRALTLELVKDAATLEKDQNQQKMTDAFKAVTTAAFIRTAHTKLKACADVNQRWKCLDEIENRLSRFNRNQCRTGNLAIRQQRAAAQAEDRQKATDELEDAEDRRQKLLYFELQPEVKKLVQQCGDNLKTLDLAIFLLELKNNLPTGFLTQKADSTPEGRPSTIAQSATVEVPRVPDSVPASDAPTEQPSAPTLTSALANNLRSTQYAIPSLNTPETTPKTPVIRVNQAAGECSKNASPGRTGNAAFNKN